MIALIIIIVLLLLIGLWLVSAQRKLVSADEICSNSLSQIGVQLNSRWDALSALADLTKGYNEHEYNTLKDIIAQRTSVNASTAPVDIYKQEEKIGAALRQINVVAEQYPELKANDMYARTMDSVNQYEGQVRLSRMTYNDTVTKLNRMVRMYPDSFAARIFGFKEREYLHEPAGKTDMPSMR